MQKYTEQATVKKVQKFYSNLANAYALARKENGPVSDWNLDGRTAKSSAKIYEILFKPYFKISKNCILNKNEKCIANVNYKSINGSNQYLYNSNNLFYKIVLDDGAAVWWSSTDDNTTIYINYDVNGVKEPNKWGVDTFEFQIKKEKVFPAGTGIEFTISYHCSPNTSFTGGGLYCTSWVVYKGNMDYLHCTGLSWTGKDKCK